jgi:hypothetical protein
MIPLADAAPASGGIATVTLITGILLALAAIISSLTPIFLARRRTRKEALAAAAASAVTSSDLTLAGWTQLNAALQQEIGRLQGVTERMQGRIDLLEAEIATLQKLAAGFRADPP